MDKLQNRRWTKWTPRDIKETDEYNVREMEKMLKTRWADALLGLLVPHIGHYPTLRQHKEIGGPTQAATPRPQGGWKQATVPRLR